MNKEYIQARIDDWEQRLNRLYSEIEAWYDQLPDVSPKQFLRGSVLQRDEEPMVEFDITPRMFPTCSIIYGKNRLSFVPNSLWIIGANGRVNVTTNSQGFALVDMGGANDLPSNWQIVTSKLRQTYRPFDQETFSNLLRHQSVEAA